MAHLVGTKFGSYIVRSLRRLFVYWPPRGEARKRQEVSKNVYRCEDCGNCYLRGNTHVDHHVPVVGPEGIVGWDAYVERLFCDASNLKVLCKGCHGKKTKKENAERAEVRRRKARPVANNKRVSRRSSKSKNVRGEEI